MESAADVDVDVGADTGQDVAGNIDGNLAEFSVWMRLECRLDHCENATEVGPWRDLAEAGKQADGVVGKGVGSEGADVTRGFG